MRSRADGRALHTGRRRLRSGRGAAFLEFALLAPLLLMVCSLMIETAAFWDASVMANHTAWTVGRIMKVKPSAKDSQIFQVGELTKSSDGAFKKKAFAGVNKLIKGVNILGDQRNLTTVLLMSSCSIGYVGTPGHELADIFQTALVDPMKDVANEIPNAISSMITGVTSPSDEKGGSGFVDKIRQAVAKWVVDTLVKPVVGAVLDSLLAPVTDWIKARLAGVGEKLNALLNQGDTFSPFKHYARNLQKSLHRVADLADGKKGHLVLTQTANTGAINGITFLEPLDTLSYPRVNAADPGLEGQVMLVRVQWPMESDWLFPLFWGGARTNTGVWASGNSLVLLETTLKSDDLLSTGKSSYTPPGTNKPPLGGVGDEIRKDSRIELFLMRYRNTREELYIQDSESVFKTKWLQPWRDIAYPGQGSSRISAAYRASWAACLDAGWGLRGCAFSTVKGWLKDANYPAREWLYYEGTEQHRYRYTGNKGRYPATTIAKLVFTTDHTQKKNVYSPKRMQEQLQALGYGTTLPVEPDAAILAAQLQAETALQHYAALRNLVDANIAELTKRIEGDGNAEFEMDPDTLSSLTGEDLAKGDAELTEQKVRERWRKLRDDLKACRDRLNPIVQQVAAARTGVEDSANALRATLQGIYTTQVQDFFKADKEKKAKNRTTKKAKAAEALVSIYWNKLWPQTQKLVTMSVELEQAAAAATSEEIRLGNLFNLDATSKLDPEKVDWDQIAEGLAQHDGVPPTKDPTDDGRTYGDNDNKGEGPWKR